MEMLAVVGAVFAMLALERAVLRWRPLWLSRLAFPLGKRRLVRIDDARRNALLDLGAEGGYRERLDARVDWSRLDPDEIHAWLSDTERTVDLVTAHAVLVVRPRSTFGRNRGVWASFWRLELDAPAKTLSLTHRFYLGDLAWPVAVAFIGLRHGEVVNAAIVAPVFLLFLVVRATVTYYQLQSLPTQLTARLEKCLAESDERRIAEAREEEDAPASAPAAEAKRRAGD